jgi:LysR family hydrogen peroxide-inducible transcriptional activator
MELFQVRYFLALAKTLNFTRAAEACNVSQPALTRAIQRLEEEIGGPLLYRERSLTHLTQLGHAMLPHLEAAHAAAEAAAAQAAAFRRRESAPLSLGLGSTLSIHMLTPVLRELQERIDGFELSLTEGGSDDLFERMLNGQLDAAIVVEPEKIPERLNRWPLFRDPYVVLCPEGHRLAALDEVPGSALEGEVLLARARPGCDFEAALGLLCRRAEIKPKPRHSAASEDHIQAMVAAGLGLAISAAHQPVGPGVVARPLAGPELARRIQLMAVAGRPNGPGLAAFLTLMRARDWRGPTAEENPAGKPARASKR